MSTRLFDEVHVSVDIEACGEVLVSLGACVFDPRIGEPGTCFYGVPNMKDQTARGLKLDADAFSWWLKQNNKAREAVMLNRPAEEVLSGWRSWWAQLGGDPWLWAYPTSFDLPVIAHVYDVFGLRPPWKWTRTLDGRTLWQLAIAIDPDMAKIEAEAGPCPHHALEDAKEQARWFARYLTPVVRR
jgi:hypothetical protein